MIESTRSDEEPKLSSTVVPGWAASKSSAIWVNASVSDEAAKTVTVWASPAVAVVGVLASPLSATSSTEP